MNAPPENFSAEIPHGFRSRVAVHCPAGHPCVLMLYPLQRRRGQRAPFPTLYWLICPRLCTELAHLERIGTIAALAAELAAPSPETNAENLPNLRAQLAHAHQDYIAQRWALLTPQDQHFITTQGWLRDFQQRGIGGLRNPAAVKCLHLHLAHELARGNPLGRLLTQRYNLHRCDN